jgi:hypothetical protein
MKICVAGWYFRPEYLKAVASSGYDSFVIKHKEGDTQGIPSQLYENRGLEFGAYKKYVEEHWDGVSDVFFCHDDAEVSDLIAFKDVEGLKDRGVEQAYIFRDEYDEYINGGCHGRAMWIRGDYVAKLKEDFPADMDNTGLNIGVTAQKGILMFHQRIESLGKNTAVIALVPQMHFAHRGLIHDSIFVYRKTHLAVPGGIVNVSK